MQNPKEFQRHSRYHALGIDVYLITKLGYLWQVMPDYTIEGAGALIYQDQQQQLHRRLEPLTYSNGRIKQLHNSSYTHTQWIALLQQAL